MRRFALPLALCLPLAASAAAQAPGAMLGDELRQAAAEQRLAEREAARLERIARSAGNEAQRLRAEQAAAAQEIQAAEARISTADARLWLVAATIASYRRRLEREQRPVSSLLAGLGVMAERPPLLALADRGSTDELVEVRLLLDSTLPTIRARTARLSQRLARGEQLQHALIAARSEVERSRHALTERRQAFAVLERKALERALTAGTQALSASDVAISTGETVERLRSAEIGGRTARALAVALAAEPPAPPRPFRAEGAAPVAPFAYRLPADTSVTEGLGAVSESGVRSRGILLASRRGTPIFAPGDGVVRFAGPFREFDGVLIIDHGRGWASLLVNAASDLRPGTRVRLGQPVGRALGPLSVELSRNGRRISPAVIAGSSASLSKTAKGG